MTPILFLGWRLPFQIGARSEKNTRVRYIAGPPAARRGTQPSQDIVPVTPFIGLASRAPDTLALDYTTWLWRLRRLTE